MARHRERPPVRLGAWGRHTCGDSLIRSTLKRRVEQVLASDAVARLTRRRVRGRALILAYHAVVPRNEGRRHAGEQALFVTQSKFAEHLDAVAEAADVVPIAGLEGDGSGRPRIAITFDDAYQGAVTGAVDELVARGLPATIFVAPGRLDGHVFWWDALAGESGILDTRIRDYALDALCGEDERIRSWASGAGLKATDDLPRHARSASQAELRAAAQRPGISIGSHSWSHTNLARLDATQLTIELQRPLAWIREQFGTRAIPGLAYPYGLESSMVRSAAAFAGYSRALRISGGWFRPDEVSPLAWPRLNIPSGLSANGLRARLAGAIRA